MGSTTSTILFIENPFSVTHFLIRSWRSCLCQYRRRCGTHLFPPFTILSNLVRKYRSGGMMWEAWLRFPMRDSSLSVFLLLMTSTLWCPLPRLPTFLWIVIHVVIGYGCSIPYMYCSLQVTIPLIFCGGIGGRPELVVPRSEAAGIWYGSPVMIRFV